MKLRPPFFASSIMRRLAPTKARMICSGASARPPASFSSRSRLGDAARVHRIEPAPEHRLDERVLGAEVVVDRGEIGAPPWR